MRFVDKILGKSEERMVKNLVNGMYHSMLTAAIATKDKYPDRKNYSEYAKMALALRPHWKQVNDETFEYSRWKEKKQIKILQNDSLMDVIQRVATVEVYAATKDLDPDKMIFLLDLGLRELDKYKK